MKLYLNVIGINLPIYFRSTLYYLKYLPNIMYKYSVNSCNYISYEIMSKAFCSYPA